MRLYRTLLVLALLSSGCQLARADIGLLLNATPNTGWEPGSSITGEGHAAVYLSRVCPESPVKLRMCRPGEPGSVIQNYENFKEDQPYEWNAVPLNIYLYGMDDRQQRPLFASPELRTILQEDYREKYLAQICTRATCLTDPEANWRDAVAAAFVREIYVFEVRTTVEQDERFVHEFNARANVNHYSGVRRNCADFAKFVVNSYFPHSAHRDFLNDFGMTGPKAIARSFSHYAEKRPDLEFRVVRIEQLPGTYKRSTDTHEGTEQIFRAKKWLLPMMLFTYHVEPVIAASYFLTGRFNPDHELRNWPSDEAADLREQLAQARKDNNAQRERELDVALRKERSRELGDEKQWEQYRARFDEIVRSAIDDGVISDRRQIHNLFRDLSAQGKTYLAGDGQAWLEMDETTGERKVGLSAADVFQPGSDRQLALQILIARIDAILTAKTNHRELWPEFQSDWALLEKAQSLLPPREAAPRIAAKISNH